MERLVVASAQEISSGMPEFSIQRSAGEPQGTAGAKATQRRSQNAKCRMQKGGAKPLKGRVWRHKIRSAAKPQPKPRGFSRGTRPPSAALLRRTGGKFRKQTSFRFAFRVFGVFRGLPLVGESSPSANNLDYCSGVQSQRPRAPADQGSAPQLNCSAAELPHESGLNKLGCSKTWV